MVDASLSALISDRDPSKRASRRTPIPWLVIAAVAAFAGGGAAISVLARAIGWA